MNSTNISTWSEPAPLLTITGRILVCCPGGLVTGGPELLHQLVNELRNLGHDSYVCYYPFDRVHECPKEYANYNAPQARFCDQSGDLIILPEVRTILTRRFRHAKVAIWWLSVDNYFGRRGESWLSDTFRTTTSLIRNRLPLKDLATLTHLVQSAYARDFLARASISSVMLTDYLSREHFEPKNPTPQKMDIIAYNPRKGVRRTLEIIKSNKDLSFIPIQGMKKHQVSDLLSRAKIYIDFGSHPGKDRLPREAAMAGCCVITGVQGAAGNTEDVPIPRRYKLNDNNRDYLPDFARLAKDIFSNHEDHNKLFDEYRASIRLEPILFKQQVIKIFGQPHEPPSVARIKDEKR